MGSVIVPILWMDRLRLRGKDAQSGELLSGGDEHQRLMPPVPQLRAPGSSLWGAHPCCQPTASLVPSGP